MNLYFNDLLSESLSLLRDFEPKDGYWLAFSGGKDSQVIYQLCVEAGVKFTSHYNVTNVDPLELLQFIRKNYPDVIWEYPKKSMLRLIEEKLIPPTRLARYCCEKLKERTDLQIGKTVITGVRAAESPSRKKRRASVELFKNKSDRNATIKLRVSDNYNREQFESCYTFSRSILNPILYWSDDDVWNYLKMRGIESCSLYQKGLKRIGCIACPFSPPKQRKKDLDNNPKIKNYYLKAFELMIKNRINRGLSIGENFETPEAVMEWWLSK